MRGRNAAAPATRDGHSSWGERAVLAAILGMAAFLRLYRLDLTWFHLDQVRDVSSASLIASGQALPLLGPHIGGTGAYLGPFYFYFLSVPFLFARDPSVAAVLIAISNILAIVLAYFFIREYFAASIALMASALFAVFPLVILSSQVAWNSGLVPLFTIVFMRELYALVVKGHSSSVVWLLALLAILTQLHLATVAFAAVLLLACALFRPTVKTMHVLVGLAVALVLYSPYVVYELSSGFENTRALIRFTAFDQHLTGRRAFGGVVESVLLLFWPVLHGFTEEQGSSPIFLGAFWILYAVEAFLFGLGILLCLYRLLVSWRRTGAEEVSDRRRLGLLFLWVLVPILILANKKTAIWWYYLDLLYPAQFIFAAIALSSLPLLAARSSRNRRRIGWASVGVVLALVFSQAYLQVDLRLRVDRQGEVVLPVRTFSISASPSPVRTLTAIPLGYRRAILRTLVEEFGLDEQALVSRVHGPVLGLPEENEFIFRYLEDRAGPGRPSPRPSTTHYLVTKEGHATTGVDRIRAKSVGPYSIIEYRPAVDYGSWRYATASRGAVEETPDADWKRLDVPAVDVDLREGQPWFFRGILRMREVRQDVSVVVNVISWTPLESIEVQIDGRRVAAEDQVTRQRQLINVTSSRSMMSAGWTTETLYRLKGPLVPGAYNLLIAMAGAGHLVRLDVYEGHVP